MPREGKRSALDDDVPSVNIRREGWMPRQTIHRFSSSPQPRQRMMMASDSSHPSPSRLDDATVAALRDALRCYLSDDSNAAPLQDALVRMSAEARDKRLPAEQLLVQLKDAWSTLPDVRAMTDAAEQVRVLQRVVTMCIKEYYAN